MTPHNCTASVWDSWEILRQDTQSETSYLFCIGLVRGQQPLVSFWAREDLELNRRNMKGFMAEFDTIQTPRTA